MRNYFTLHQLVRWLSERSALINHGFLKYLRSTNHFYHLIVKDGMMTSQIRIFVLLFLAHTGIVLGQTSTIEGIVLDGETKQPLSFASIGIKGTLHGTATNSEGRFIMTVPEQLSDSTLICSYMGYKSFERPVKKLGAKIEIKLKQDTFTLDEVEVRPWEPWDYIWNAMQKIPDNYPQKAFMTQGYYSEYVTENDVFLKFTEGVVEIYNPDYASDQKTQSKVLKARRGEDLGTLQFMRETLEKKHQKEIKKAEKKEEEIELEETIDKQIISASFGGPETILSFDPLRDTADFLDIKSRKKYKYFIDGITKYQGEDVIIIAYESKGIYEHQRQSGKVYISLASDAIISIEHDSEIVIPGIARPVIFAMGLGITNPELHGKVHYKSINGRWFVSDISMEGNTRLTKKKMFKKNDRSLFDFEIALINNKFDLENVAEIPKEERIDNDKPLEEQVEPDPEFWKTYKVVRHSGYFD